MNDNSNPIDNPPTNLIKCYDEKKEIGEITSIIFSPKFRLSLLTM